MQLISLSILRGKLWDWDWRVRLQPLSAQWHMHWLARTLWMPMSYRYVVLWPELELCNNILVVAALAVVAGRTAELLNSCGKCGLRSSARAPLAISVYTENQRWLALASGVPRLWHILPEEAKLEKSAWFNSSHESYVFTENIFLFLGCFFIYLIDSK